MEGYKVRIETDRWHYKLYEFSFSYSDETVRFRTTNFCTYWRRILLYTPVLAGVCVLFMVIAALVTIVTNLVTVPLGFGIAVAFPGEEILQIPFRVTVRGEKRSLAKFLVPFWVIAAIVYSLWFHSGATISVLKWAGIVILANIGLFLARVFVKEKIIRQGEDGPVSEWWRLTKLYLRAKKEKVCPLIEFVEPSERELHSSEPPLV